MRRDLIIGIFVSILAHVGFFYGSNLFPTRAKVRTVVHEKTYTVDLTMPKLEEEPEIVNDTTADSAAQQVQDFAPPMQADVPSLITVDSFVQQIQPPPPEGLKPNPGVLTIPVNRSTGGAKLSNVFNLADLDQPPVPRVQQKPIYPFEMRRAGITGTCVVAFIVDSNGDVRDAYAQRSTQREFEQPAVQAVMKWKFKPGRKGGKAVNTRMIVPIEFSLNSSDE